MLSLKRGIGLNLLFAMGVCAAWSWFDLHPPKSNNFFYIAIKHSLPNWNFRRLPLDWKSVETLATTNLFNGIFYGPDSQRITVFAAEWKADDNQRMQLNMHTPDVCWPSMGWEIVECSCGEFANFQIGNQNIPFTIRMFRSTSNGELELCVWVTLIDGEVYRDNFPKSYKKTINQDTKPRVEAASRELAAGFFVKSIINRTGNRKTKQFIRISAGRLLESEPKIEEIERFASTWLDCQNRSR